MYNFLCNASTVLPEIKKKYFEENCEFLNASRATG
jgi:hypothetical protein